MLSTSVPMSPLLIPTQLDLLDQNQNNLGNVTTAIYPNRIRDKAKLEKSRGYTEFGSQTALLYTSAGTLLAEGYLRVVYGDHGPYLEIDPTQIRCQLRRKFGQPPPADAYYDWQEPEDHSRVKVYVQLRDVHHLPNPPAGGFRGNRSEGYADYKPGLIYVSPYALQLKM